MLGKSLESLQGAEAFSATGTKITGVSTATFSKIGVSAGSGVLFFTSAAMPINEKRATVPIIIHLGADNRIPLIAKTKKSIIYIAEIKSRVKKNLPSWKTFS
jgi:hypothetical protein